MPALLKPLAQQEEHDTKVNKQTQNNAHCLSQGSIKQRAGGGIEGAGGAIPQEGLSGKMG